MIHRRGFKYIVGIDEAGRGPLAGDVAVGVVIVPAHFDRRCLKGIRDSKQLSERARKEWFEFLKYANKHGVLEYTVSYTSPQKIDAIGIVPAVSLAIERSLKRLRVKPKDSLILLDGGLRAPAEYMYQQTIVRGDARVPLIALASIAAKVTRDHRITRLSRQYPLYKFDVHKGYGTREHIRLIKKYGLCAIHRRSFVKWVD